MLGPSLLGFFTGLISIFLMFLILIQRGKGGGLTGALGGMGGQSAFGSKAGDLFTRITVITAIIWMTCCLLIIKIYNAPPATVKKADESGVLTSDEAATSSGISGDGGGDFKGDISDSGDEDGNDNKDAEANSDADESTDPIIEDTSDEAGKSEDPETNDNNDAPPVIDPETEASSGEANKEGDN